MMLKPSRHPHEVIPHPSLRRLSYEQLSEQIIVKARTEPCLHNAIVEAWIGARGLISDLRRLEASLRRADELFPEQGIPQHTIPHVGKLSAYLVDLHRTMRDTASRLDGWSESELFLTYTRARQEDRHA
jgi:hypothetical protein